MNKILTKEVYDNYVAILKSKLVPALGCTEPIAVAYEAAKARGVWKDIRKELKCGAAETSLKGRMGSKGMKDTDVEILKIMINQ